MSDEKVERAYKIDCTLKLCSPDDLNEIGRNLNLPVQAASLYDNLSNTIYLAWPPTIRGTPAYEYGMDAYVLLHALGYEITNLLHLDTDPLGR